MKWWCDTNQSATPTGSACCLRSVEYGSTCIRNTSATTADTYAIGTAQEDYWLGDNATYDFDNANVVTAKLSDTSIYDPFFEIWDCSNSQTNYFTCYKFQVAQDKQSNAWQRYDPDTVGAKAVFYDANGGAVAGSYTTVNITKFTGATTVMIASLTAVTAALLSF